MRTLPASALTDNAISEWVVKLWYWNGATEEVIKLTTASQDIDITDIEAGSGLETFVGTGIALSISSTTEDVDPKAQSVELILDGVDQTIISIIMQNQFRGRRCAIWQVWFNESTGEVDGSPVLRFDGYQNDAYNITESQMGERAVTLSTRVMSRMTKVLQNYVVRTNETSHNEMLKRAGLSTGDTFFKYTPGIANKPVFWGEAGPYYVQSTPERGRDTDREMGR